MRSISLHEQLRHKTLAALNELPSGKTLCQAVFVLGQVLLTTKAT
jgi:hypothetical protein